VFTHLVLHWVQILVRGTLYCMADTHDIDAPLGLPCGYM
jgi:hypothetical protein